MALNYTTAPGGIFVRGGKIVAAVNAHAADPAVNLPNELKQVVDPFEDSDTTALVDGIYRDYDDFKQQFVVARQRIATYFDAVLRDRAVVEELRLTVDDLPTVLPTFFRQMVDDAQTVQRSTVTVGAAVPSASNVGTGTVLLTKRLDGFSAPVDRGVPIPQYAGRDSELAAPAETMLFECTDAGSSGRETLSWSGGILTQKFDWRDEGSGPGPRLRLDDQGAILDNGGFEFWAGTPAAPSSWTVIAGTAGTHVQQATGAGTFYRGTSALRLLGDGATKPAVRQAITRRLDPLRMYCLSCYVKHDLNHVAGDLRVSLTGTGYVASMTDKIELTPAQMSSSTFVLASCFVLMPAAIPDDMSVTVEVVNANETTGQSIYVDLVTLQEVAYFAGVGAAAVAGAVNPVRGDRWTADVTNDHAGVFQEFARVQWGIQFPSSATPTISDALATLQGPVVAAGGGEASLAVDFTWLHWGAA